MTLYHADRPVQQQRAKKEKGKWHGSGWLPLRDEVLLCESHTENANCATAEKTESFVNYEQRGFDFFDSCA